MSGSQQQDTVNFSAQCALIPPSLRGASVVWTNPALHVLQGSAPEEPSNSPRATCFFTIIEKQESRTLWLGVAGPGSLLGLKGRFGGTGQQSWLPSVVARLASSIPTADLCARLDGGWTIILTGFSIGGAVAASVAVRGCCSSF